VKGVIENFLGRGFVPAFLGDIQAYDQRSVFLSNIAERLSLSDMHGGLWASPCLGKEYGNDSAATLSTLWRVPPVRIQNYRKIRIVRNTYLFVVSFVNSFRYVVSCYDEWHPHAYEDGTMCLDTYGNAMSDSAMSNDYDAFLQLLLNSLSSINPDSLANRNSSIGYICSCCRLPSYDIKRSLVTRRIYCSSCARDIYGAVRMEE